MEPVRSARCAGVSRITVGLSGIATMAMLGQASRRYLDRPARPTNRFAFAYRRAADKLQARGMTVVPPFRRDEPGFAVPPSLRRMPA
ncbi:hypothetical protein [Burkholderia cepacia]|uniref:hypothetical protein n=1 Tax=Burkholderia cepacia TaxID=292 RepID=UPI0021AB1944|nr:hypothetical protein [Burkholderia cepacia]